MSNELTTLRQCIFNNFEEVFPQDWTLKECRDFLATNWNNLNIQVYASDDLGWYWYAKSKKWACNGWADTKEEARKAAETWLASQEK